MNSPYPPSINLLFTLGIPSHPGIPGWTEDYLALGITAEDIPALKEIASEDITFEEDEPPSWATLHAWRALIQLRAPEVVALLLEQCERDIDVVDDAWCNSDTCEAAVRLGPSALPEIATYLNDRAKPPEVRKWLGEGIARLGVRYPEAREDCIRALVVALNRYREQDDLFNANIASNLTELRAMDTVPLIEEVYRSERADLSMCGDWEDIQIELGLIPARLTKSTWHEIEMTNLHKQDSTFHPPVDQLLTLGKPKQPHNLNEVDYASFGITTAHVPDLIRMLCDEALYTRNQEGTLGWGPVHAWRALAQLRSVEAIDPLISQWYRFIKYHNDWISEEYRFVFANIGVAAIPALSKYVSDVRNELYCRTNAIEAMVEIVNQHSDERAVVVAFLSERLNNAKNDDETFNAHVIWSLLDLHAVECAPAMQAAFEANLVDESEVGDWEDAQITLGLLEKRLTPKKLHPWLAGLPAIVASERIRAEQLKRKPSNANKKAKRKLQKQSRKKNRK